MNSKIKETFFRWLPLGVAITLMSGMVYLVAQQNYRQTANDPQVQIAEDGANASKDGKPMPNSIDLRERVDIVSSLSVYAISYNKNGKPVVGNGYIDGQLASLPSGVFDNAKKHGEGRFTWQPKKGVRSAGVLTYFKGRNEGFVFAGRSLKEVEKREDKLALQIKIAWFITVIASYVTVYLIAPQKLKK